MEEPMAAAIGVGPDNGADRQSDNRHRRRDYRIAVISLNGVVSDPNHSNRRRRDESQYRPVRARRIQSFARRAHRGRCKNRSG